MLSVFLISVAVGTSLVLGCCRLKQELWAGGWGGMVGAGGRGAVCLQVRTRACSCGGRGEYLHTHTHTHTIPLLQPQHYVSLGLLQSRSSFSSCCILMGGLSCETGQLVQTFSESLNNSSCLGLYIMKQCHMHLADFFSFLFLSSGLAWCVGDTM